MPRILEDRSTDDYEPTAREIEEYAEWLGMDLKKDADLLWIARQGLKTPLVKPWKACESGEGEIFYFNAETGESRWDHPCDEELQRLYASERAKRAERAQRAALPPAPDAEAGLRPAAAPGTEAEDVKTKLPAAPDEGHGGESLGDAGRECEQPSTPVQRPSEGGIMAEDHSVDDLCGMPLDPCPGSRRPPTIKAGRSSSTRGADGPVSNEADVHELPAGDIESMSPVSDIPMDVGYDLAASAEPLSPVPEMPPDPASPQVVPKQEPSCGNGNPPMHEAATEQRAEVVSDPLPQGLIDADSLSPPTPELNDILAAELRVDESKEQLSLWSQIEEGTRDEPPSASAWQLRPENSLELSSLTAVLERSPDGGACNDAKGVVEELQRLQSEHAAAVPRCVQEAHDAEGLELEMLRKELATTKHDCDHLRAAVGAAAARSREEPQGEGATPVLGDPAAATSTEGPAGHEGGPLGSTIKLRARWNEAQEAQLRAEDSARQMEQFQEELLALAERVRAMEAARPESTSARPSRGAEASNLKPHTYSAGGGATARSAGRQSAGEKDAVQTQHVEDARHESLALEVQSLRASVLDGERLLQETRLMLQREQASHCAMQASLRESQHEVLRLRSQLKHKDADVDRARAETQRLQVEFATRDDENHQLQLQLQSRDAELSQLRVQLAAQARQSDTAFQRQRLELREREQKLEDRERCVSEQEARLGELELQLRRQQREARAGPERPQMGAPQAAMPEAVPHCGGHQATGTQASPAAPSPSEATRGPVRGARLPEHGAARGRRSRSARPAAARRDGCAEPQAALAPAGSACGGAGAESLSSPDNEGAALPASDLSTAQNSAQCFEARCLFESPSPGSSTVSAKEGKDDCNCLAEDAGDDSKTTGFIGTVPQDHPNGITFFNARSTKEMSEMLHVRRRELRCEHAELEEERRQWRNEMRRARRANSGGTPAKMDSEARSALDSRAASLNRAIGEYRALEQFLVSQQRRASADHGPLARSSRVPAGLGSPSAPQLGVPTKAGLEGERSFRQKQHTAASQQGAAASEAAACGAERSTSDSCHGCSSRHRLQASSCPASPCPHRSTAGGA